MYGKECFGFYIKSPTCEGCDANRRCKSVTVTNGYDIIGEMVDHLVESLEDKEYVDADSMSLITEQILNNGTFGTKKSKEVKVSSTTKTKVATFGFTDV